MAEAVTINDKTDTYAAVVDSTGALKTTVGGSGTTATQVMGAAADGASATGINPVLVSGVDGSGNEQSLLTDTSGRLTPQPAVTPGSSASITRPNDTSNYVANDVIGSSTSTSSAMTFAVSGAAGQDVIITSTALEIDIAAVVSGMTSFNLALYNVTPPSAYGDNAAWDLASGDRASFLGIFSLGTPADLGSTLWVGTDIINKQITVASGNIFGYLITVGAWTPAASSVFKVTIHTVPV